MECGRVRMLQLRELKAVALLGSHQKRNVWYGCSFSSFVSFLLILYGQIVLFTMFGMVKLLSGHI